MKKIVIAAAFIVLTNFTMKIQSNILKEEHTAKFLSVAFKDGLIKLLNNDNTVKLKPLKKESLIKFSINDKFWAVAYNNKIEIYNIKKSKINTIVLTDEIKDITFSKRNDNVLAAYSIDGTIKIYNIKTEEVKTLFYDSGAFDWSQIKKIQFSSNDDFLYFYNDQDEVGIYNLTKYDQCQSDIIPIFCKLTSVTNINIVKVFTEKGYLAIVHNNNQLKVLKAGLDVASKSKNKYFKFTQDITKIKFSNNTIKVAFNDFTTKTINL